MDSFLVKFSVNFCPYLLLPEAACGAQFAERTCTFQYITTMLVVDLLYSLVVKTRFLCFRGTCQYISKLK